MLRRGSDFYPALDGIVSKNGGNIDELLKNEEVLEKMAGQIESKIDIKSKEELAMDIIHSDNPAYSEVYRVTTDRNDFNWKEIDEYMSKKEMMLSKLIGKPHPSYVITGLVGRDYEQYNTKIAEEGRDYGANTKTLSIANTKKSAKHVEEKKGTITFEDGALHITSKELLAGGLDPDKMGWEEITKERVTEKKNEYKQLKKELDKMKKEDSFGKKFTIDRLEEEVKQAEQSMEDAKKDYEEYVVTPRSMAKAAQKQEVAKSEVKGIKTFFDRALSKDSTQKENIGEGKEEI